MITACASSCRGPQGEAAQGPPPRITTPPAADHSPGEWKEFSSRQGRFTILFPVAPEEEDHAYDTPSGRLDSREYRSSEDAADYAVDYRDYQIDLEADAETLNYVMDRLRDAGTSYFNGRVLSESEVSLGGHPGRALKVGIAEGIIWVRMYAVGRRLYQVAVTTRGEQSAPGAGRADEARAMKFLDSFRLLAPED